MAADPYEILGLARNASADDIRNAYRKLAKKHHPDLNPGNKAAEERFKQVSAANEILSDPDKRAAFDRGEIDATGAPAGPPPGYRDYAEANTGARYAHADGFASGAGGENFEDLFASMFEARGPARPAAGQDAQYSLQIAFLDAINGATSRLTLPDGKVLDVKIPIGAQDGDILRLRGRGHPGRRGGPAGDALIELHVIPHPFFHRNGQDIELDVPVSLIEAVTGARITIPTPAGDVAMSLKPGSDTGTKLRLRGRGVPAHGTLPAGDLYATLRVVIGPVDEKLTEFLSAWTQAAFDPRSNLKVTS